MGGERQGPGRVFSEAHPTGGAEARAHWVVPKPPGWKICGRGNPGNPIIHRWNVGLAWNDWVARQCYRIAEMGQDRTSPDRMGFHYSEIIIDGTKNIL
jgi:hypothetical protein